MTIRFYIFSVIIGVTLLVSCQNKTVFDKNTAFGEKIVRLGDTVIAEIDGTSIYLSDIEKTALAKGLINEGESLSPQNPQFQTILDELIDQRLLALEALRLSLDQNDDTRRRLAMARERILANVMVENVLAETINDEAVKRIYNEQTRLFNQGQLVRARLIVTDSKQKAVDIKKIAEKQGDFAKLAKQYSIDNSTRDLGGDLGFFGKDAVDKQIAKHAFALKKGEISEPFQTDKGKDKKVWNILYLVDKKLPKRPKLEEVRSDIVKYMTYEEIKKKIASLRLRSNIKLNLAGANSVSDDNMPEKDDKDEKDDKND